MKVAVTGAGGQLGQAMALRLSERHEVAALARAELDVTRAADVARVMAAIHPDAIVNCAAYNAVDRAEDDVLAALDGNAFAVQALARAAAREGAVLVHYSTDFVFDGNADRPYVEDAPVSPLSVYGQSKLLGEWLTRDAPRRYILRVESLFGGPLPRSSIDRIAEAIRAGRETQVFEDRVVSPAFVEDVVTATEALLDRGIAGGVYHCVNSGHATWQTVAQEIGAVLGVEPQLVPVRLADVPMRARRPRFCALSNAKLASAGITMPTWQDALRRHLAAR
jgi:dTDP-4-dehydrorhamnose reductase